jgi:hypothetical protein
LGSFLVRWPKIIVKVIGFNKLLDKDVHDPRPIPIPIVIDSNSGSGDPFEINKSLDSSSLLLISETEDALFSYREIQDVGNKVTFALVYSRVDIAAEKDHLSLPVVTVKTIFNYIWRRQEHCRFETGNTPFDLLVEWRFSCSIEGTIHNKTITSGTVKAYTVGSHGQAPHVILECTFHHQNSPADTFLQHFLQQCSYRWPTEQAKPSYKSLQAYA